MKLKMMSVGMAGLLLAGGVDMVWADEAKQGSGLTPEVVEQLAVANKLIALGDARKDPLLLIAAAKLQKSLGAEAVSSPSQSRATGDVLERAKKLAVGRKDLIGIADDVAAAKSKSYRSDCMGFQHGACNEAVLY